MATTAKNNIKRQLRPGAVLASGRDVVDSSVTFNQGDLIALVSGKLKAIAADGDTATLLGVAAVSVVSGKQASPYTTAVDASQAAGDIPGPIMGCICELTLNTGDAFNPGDLVYPIGSVDAQTVSSSSNTGARSPCGIYQGKVVASASAGQLGEVLVGAQVNGQLVI